MQRLRKKGTSLFGKGRRKVQKDIGRIPVGGRLDQNMNPAGIPSHNRNVRSDDVLLFEKVT